MDVSVLSRNVKEAYISHTPQQTAKEMTRQVVGTSGRPNVSTKCKELIKVVQFMATMSLHGIGTYIPGSSTSIAMALVSSHV